MCRNRISGLLVAGIVSCHLQVLAKAQERESKQPLPSSIQKLRERNAKNAERVTGCVRMDRIIEREKTLPDEMDELRGKLTQGALEAMEQTLQAAREDGATERQLEDIRADFARRIGAVEDHVAGRHLRKSSIARLVSAIDFVGQRGQGSLVERRFLQGPEDEVGVPESQLPSSGTIAFVRDPWKFDAEREWLRFGIIPASIFEGPYEFKRKTSEQQSGHELDIVVTDAETKKIASILTLRTDLGTLLTRLRRAAPDGTIFLDFTASDFRKVDGVYVPFRTRTLLARDGVIDYNSEETIIESILLNPVFTEDQFKNPGGALPTTQPAP